MIIAIDASRNRSGGAKAHLIGIITSFEPKSHKIEVIHVWSYRELLDQLPDRPWLVKHSPPALEGSLIKQLLWQARDLAHEAKVLNCDILFTTDASSMCQFNPMVTLSQDMLSYEPGVMSYFGFGLARLRLLIILVLQNLAFRRSVGVIFLTNYARETIQKSCGFLKNTSVIPHGVDDSFKSKFAKNNCDKKFIECVYVSNSEMYKHQWIVVEAISLVRRRGYNVKIRLIGGGHGKAHDLLLKAISIADPDRIYVEQLAFLPHDSLPEILTNADIFIFASSCENMPVTLVEGMAIGLPIACSNRGPMPEVLSDGGLYFDPENAISIADAIEELVASPSLRQKLAQRAKSLSKQYNWTRCSNDTFSFIEETYIGLNK